MSDERTRDKFAGRAMQVLLTKFSTDNAEQVAKLAYDQADAMMEARRNRDVARTLDRAEANLQERRSRPAAI